MSKKNGKAKNTQPIAFQPDWPTLDGLRFTPTAWNKLLYMLHAGPTEVGGWGIVSKADPVLVYDFCLVEQEATAAHFEFTEKGMEDYRFACLDADLDPVESERIWIHTHPNIGANPSGGDEDNFVDNMGDPLPHWAVMCIVDRKHSTYARVQFNVGPGGSRQLPVSVDWSCATEQADTAAWDKEYDRCVSQKATLWTSAKRNPYAQIDVPGTRLLEGYGQRVDDDWEGQSAEDWNSQYTYDLTPDEEREFAVWLTEYGYDPPKTGSDEYDQLVDQWYDEEYCG